MFEQYARLLHQQYPHLSIIGDFYPPPLVNQYLAGIISVIKMALILLIVLGDSVQIFESLNIQQPDIYIWAKQNKVNIRNILVFLSHNHIYCNGYKMLLIEIDCCRYFN